MKAAINRRAAQLSKLAIKLNSDDFTVFCSFSGHINQISVEVFLTGWKDGHSPSWRKFISLVEPAALERLERTIIRIQEIKKYNSIFISNVSDQGELSDGR